MKHTRLINSSVGALAAGMLLTLLSVHAAAQNSPVLPGQPERVLDGPSATENLTPAGLIQATKHSLKGTYFNSGTWNGLTFPGGNLQYPVDTQLTVECPGRSSCTIEMNVWVEEGDAPAASEGGLCLYIDGAAYICADNNYIEPNIVRSFAQVANFTDLAPGTHTVQTYLYSGSGTSVWAYSTSYKVYTP